MAYGAPAGWYPDPSGSGGQRYFDGANWTAWSTGGPAETMYGLPYGPVAQWKGMRYGLPPYGPGSIASPGARLAARLLDGLVLSPLYVGFYVVMIVWFLHHKSNFIPPAPTPSNPNPTIPPEQLNHAFSGLFAAFMLWWFLILLVSVLYEGGLTARYGRTLGKKWMGIRPATPNGARLSQGRSFARVGAIYLGSFASILDPLWCLWDDAGECLHDKIAGTVVVNERNSGVDMWQPGIPPAGII